MTEDSHVWPYWSVDLPGLNQENAAAVIRWARERNISLGGILVDPSLFFTSSMDLDTVEALQAALGLAIASDALSHDTKVIVRGFADQLADWVAQRPSFDENEG